MSKTCGYAVVDIDGNEEPCDRPAPYWRWYQDCGHEDTLEPACDWHANEGGGRLHAAETAYREALVLWHQADPDHCGGECFRESSINSALGRA